MTFLDATQEKLRQRNDKLVPVHLHDFVVSQTTTNTGLMKLPVDVRTGVGLGMGEGFFGGFEFPFHFFLSITVNSPKRVDTVDTSLAHTGVPVGPR